MLVLIQMRIKYSYERMNFYIKNNYRVFDITYRKVWITFTYD